MLDETVDVSGGDLVQLLAAAEEARNIFQLAAVLLGGPLSVFEREVHALANGPALSEPPHKGLAHLLAQCCVAFALLVVRTL